MKKILWVLICALGVCQLTAEEEVVEIFGSADSESTVLHLNPPMPYRIAELPLSVPIDVLPAMLPEASSKVLVNGTHLTDTDTTWSPSTYGVYELKHVMTVDGVQMGDMFTVTYEVWSPELTITDCSVPLKEQLPNTYSNLTSVAVDSRVKEMCSGIFAGCSSLASLTLPDGVTTIGDSAFEGCTLLARVKIPESVDDFGMDALPIAAQAALVAGGDGLIISDNWVLGITDDSVSELVIPEGVVGIGRSALADLYDLARVQLPTTLKYICAGAFERCSYLDEVEIPEGVERIDARAFKDCSYLQTISFGEGLRIIGAEAFAGCTQLASVSFADGLETIGAKAFSGDWRMQSVTLPYSVDAIASDAFTGCSSLTGVTVPTHGGTMYDWFRPIYTQVRNVTVAKGETELTVNIFSNCTALVSVSIPEGVTNVMSGAFYNCSSLTEATLPTTTESLGSAVFRGCSSLTSMVLPENVTTLGMSAFYDCSKLASVTLSRGLTALPDYAFYRCSKLTSFVVPESVTSIGNYLCESSVSSIYYLGDAPTFGANAYYGTSSSLTSYVINGTKGWDGRAQSRDLPPSWPVNNTYARAIAFWTANEFDVTFDANGGLFAQGVDQYACAQITYTPYALPPYEPVLGGAKFMGWWTERTGGTQVTASTAVKLTKAHTLYAHWDVAPSVTIRFNAMGGKTTLGEEELVYTAESPYGILPGAVREHYEFVGWFTSATGGKKVTVASEVPSADSELFARWRPKVYEILYHSNNGSDLTVSQIFTYGDTVTLVRNGFTCTGCQFAGWSLTPGGAAVYADGKALGEVTAVQDGTIHLYAVWTGRTYAVRYDSNGGYGTMDDQAFVLGVQQVLNENAFTREGYEFVGWAKTPAGEAEYEDGALAVGLTERQNDTVVLYAVWRRAGMALDVALGVGEAAPSGLRGTPTLVNGDWIADEAYAHDGVASVRNAQLAPAAEGEIVSATISVALTGCGRGSFQWAIDCEPDYEGDWYDYAVFAIDGVEQTRFAGTVDWTKVEYEIADQGQHTLSWTFYRDDFDEEDASYANALWVDELVWERDISSYTLGDMVNAPELTLTTGGDAEWFADAETNHDGTVGLRSGTITHSQETWLETRVEGRGELTFWWKVAGQVNGSRVYDYAKVEVDGVLMARAGLVDWTQVVVSVTNAGPHVVRWTYLKNASTDPEFDCAWLDEVSWMEAKELEVIVPAAISGKADIVIAPSWFASYPRFEAMFGADYQVAIMKPTGKLGPKGEAYCVWHDYLMGTDPTDPADVFAVAIRLAEGRPILSWYPAVNGHNAAGASVRKGTRLYRVMGARELSAPSWEEVPEGRESDFRFFKVSVEMP